MKRNLYPRPPIVEAVISFRFEKPFGNGAFLENFEKLFALYPGEKTKKDLFEIIAHFDDSGVAASAKRSPQIEFMQSQDGLRRLGIGNQVISIHVLKPYPGWESFSSLLFDTLAILNPVLQGNPLTNLSIRYIDRIVFPSKDPPDFADFFRGMPSFHPPTVSNLEAFHYVSKTVDKSDGTNSVFTLASGPKTTEGYPVVLLDLVLFKEGNPVCNIHDGGWKPLVEVLHTRQRNFFEASITDKLRELFQ